MSAYPVIYYLNNENVFILELIELGIERCEDIPASKKDEINTLKRNIK